MKVSDLLNEMTLSVLEDANQAVQVVGARRRLFTMFLTCGRKRV